MIHLLIFIVVVALIVWLLTFLPIAAPFQRLILWVAVVFVIAAILLQLLGIDLLASMRHLGR